MADASTAPLAASIIIATYNRADDLRECLEALSCDALREHGVEVVVVDDGCEDGTKRLVEGAFPHMRLVENGRNGGLAFSRNQGGRAARGRLLLYLDDDAVVTPGWLDAMLAGDDGRTILGGRIVDYDGGREQGGPARSTFLGKRLPCRPAHATAGTGCNLGVPRQSFEDLGGFDEDLPYYFEDSDFCIRARKAGYRFQYVADAVVRHKGSSTRVGEAIRMQERNSTYAMLKAYRGQWGRLVTFTILNGAWMVFRLVSWGLRLRFGDCRLLLSGWWAAYRRFLRPAAPDARKV